MSKRESIARYSLIINKLRQKPATFKEISAYLMKQSELQDYNFNISLRTFQRDISDILSLYNIEIRYDFSKKVYHIDSEYKQEINERIFEAFDTFSLLKMEERISEYLIFENRGPKGTEHMFALMHAIKNSFKISFIYSKFWEDDIRQRTVEPYALKEFKNRWYLLAKAEDGTFKTFGLDRMQNAVVSTQKFKSDSGFDISTYFKHSFGIIRLPEDPEEIILSFDPYFGNYIKTMPLHPSQQILLENEAELRIKLYIYASPDFVTELLSYGSRVKVLSPQSLIGELKERLIENIAQYE